jgi:uncharacterized repeat protein (TIGR03803 family)
MKTIQLIGLALVWALGTTIHAQPYKVMVNFNGTYSPWEAGIIAQSRGGYMLSTAMDAVPDVPGVAFRVSTSGAETVLHQFDTSDGIVPYGGLTLGRDGRFYGTTFNGGLNGNGTIFQMTADGIVKTLHDFGAGDDGFPQAPPIQSLYGDLYGTASGNPTNLGSVYKIDRNGVFTLLHVFTGADGATPHATLVQATNFWFYGTTMFGGTNGLGTIFRINSSGDFEVLYNFDGAHGSIPHAGLIQASDGNFYGVTYRGGASDGGVVFKLTPARKVTVLHDFTGGKDGSGPIGRLVQGSDGYLYGTTYSGGDSGAGVLFRISVTGEFAYLYEFQPSTGANPVGLIQHTNGFLYGDTFSGGLEGHGVFFRFDLGLSPFVTFLDCYGRAGDPVQILGGGFTADSQAFFNGVPAEIDEVDPTYMRVVVPEGASSGAITVTTTKGTLKSNKVFAVRP